MNTRDHLYMRARLPVVCVLTKYPVTRIIIYPLLVSSTPVTTASASRILSLTNRVTASGTNEIKVNPNEKDAVYSILRLIRVRY